MDIAAFDGFDWDIGNRQKCLKHGVTCDEIESVFMADPLVGPDPLHSDSETRFRAIGVVQGRHVFVVFTFRTKDMRRLVRPISARFMHIKEVQNYERYRQHS